MSKVREAEERRAQNINYFARLVITLVEPNRAIENAHKMTNNLADCDLAVMLSSLAVVLRNLDNRYPIPDLGKERDEIRYSEVLSEIVKLYEPLEGP